MHKGMERQWYRDNKGVEGGKGVGGRGGVV
jgi:hypothetical protein